MGWTPPPLTFWKGIALGLGSGLAITLYESIFPKAPVAGVLLASSVVLYYYLFHIQEAGKSLEQRVAQLEKRVDRAERKSRPLRTFRKRRRP